MLEVSHFTSAPVLDALDDVAMMLEVISLPTATQLLHTKELDDTEPQKFE